MLKEELIKKVTKLELKLHEAIYKKESILREAGHLLWDSHKYDEFSSYKKDLNIEGLFYEIWKLVEFRNNIREARSYKRDKERSIDELEYLRKKLKDNNINQK